MHPEQPKIIDCAAVKCSYNRDKHCNAIAITVGGPHEEPFCDTEMYWRTKAGVPALEGEVGACHKADCEYNNMLECDAQPGIHVAVRKGHADCATYERRK